MNDDRMDLLCLLLSQLPNVGPVTGRKLLDLIKAEYDGSDASIETNIRAVMPSNKMPSSAQIAIARLSAERILDRVHSADVKVAVLPSKMYPMRLREIRDAPLVLFYRGQLEVCDFQSIIAIVGTRDPSLRAAEICRRLSRHVADEGAVIVSGLALGCDTIAHQQSLLANRPTVAILAGGLDRIDPISNTALANEIIDTGGCLITEAPLGARPRPEMFVQRNRIQSGLSDAVVVVETSAKGGSMKTGRYALRYGRKLGVVDPERHASLNGEGNAILIGEGAEPLRDRNDVRTLLTQQSMQLL